VSKRTPLPKALRLKRHLDASTVADMREFLRFWSPHEKTTQPRAVLTERLGRVMADENVVYAKVELLSERVRDVLMALLRRTHYTSDLQGLFRGIEGLEMEYYEGEAALTALARRGFVRIHKSPEWENHGRSLYSIPKETALVMRGLAGADKRPFEEIFVHDRFQPGATEQLSDDEQGDLPKNVHDAVASLEPEPLRIIAEEVLGQYGGILTRREFREIFDERRIHWRSGQFLREFGVRGLGTVGHVDLRGRGLGVDDDVLVFFHESVERYAAEQRAGEPEYDAVLTAHGDLISDVRTVLALTREITLRIAKDGSLYKASLARIAERLQFPKQFLVARDDVARRVVSIVRGLGLADSNGERRLALTPLGEEWLSRNLVDKLQDCFEFVGRDGTGTLRSLHLSHLRRILIALLTDPEERGAWWGCPSLSMLARNRYLLELTRSDDPPKHAPLAVSHNVLTELGRAAQDVLMHELYPLGLVDVAIRGDQPVAVQLSDLGRRLLAAEDADVESAKPLVVNPDFELLVLPEGDVDELLHSLDRYAVRTRTGEVVSYRLDRGLIERAAAEGETADQVLELLEKYSRAAIPQNVVYSVRQWAGSVQSGLIERGLLFTADDPAVIETVSRHAGLKGSILRTVGTTALLFDEELGESRLAQELRALGIYPR